MTKNLHLWVIPLLPLIGAAINGLLRPSLQECDGQRRRPALYRGIVWLGGMGRVECVAGQRHCASPH